MKKIIGIFAVILSAIMVFSFSSCSKEAESTPVAAEDFRVTAYIVCSDGLTEENFDHTNLDRVTDIIVIGTADFDESGKLTIAENMESDLAVLRNHMNGQRLYLNILGPSAQTDSDDWTDRMHDLADRHTNAFISGNLESEIKNALAQYGFDGVVFDYEFPLRTKDWRAFDKFILSLDETLGDEYKIGMSMVGWNLHQSKKAMEATDFFEVMSYDLWDDDGNHATFDIAKDDIQSFVDKGYDKAKLDLGLPFYARPTTHDEYWYSYKDYYTQLDENGLYDDSETGLTFSFNTYDLIKEKTEWALDNGVGGVMIWHYACDVSAEDPLSLFGAIDSAKQEAVNGALNAD